MATATAPASTPTVVVIGGGLAGCWAARAAAAAGAAAVVVRRSLGATAVSSGALDFVPPPEAADPAGWLERLPRQDPFHPYLGGGRAPGVAELDALARRLAAALTEARLPVVARLAEPLLLAAATGGVRWAGAVQATLAAGDLRRPGPVAVASIAGLRGFLARSVAEAVGEARGEPRSPVLAVEPPPGVEAAVRDDLDAGTVARALERPGGAEAMGRALRAALDAAGVAGGRVLLPAVLGLDSVEETASRVAGAAGAEVAETLSPPPSVPGWRLARASERAAALAGAEMVSGEVSAIEVERGRAVAVRAADGSTIGCDAVVLATGKFLGGGLVGDRRLREPLLDLAVSVEGAPAERFGAGDLVDRTRFDADHPFAVAGVRTDAEGHPLDGFSRARLANVTAAGALLAGVDTSLRHGGLGVLAWSAERAGRAAAAAGSPARRRGR